MNRDFLRNRTTYVALLLAPMLALAGCAVGPNYKRPAVDVPGTYRGAATEAAPTTEPKPSELAKTPAASATPQSLGDEQWWEVFQDKELQGLIRTALQNNYDVRIAAARVLEAQAQLGITRADQLPTLGVGGGVASQQSPKQGPIPSYEITEGQLTASAAWNLDFWGKYRRATEAARANLLASEWARKQVIATLVTNVAAGYFQLRQLDLQLEISQHTLASRRDSLQLTQTLEQHGIQSLLDVRQAEQLVYTAATEVPDLERQIAQREDAINILLGNNPGDVPRGLKLTEQPHAPEVPAGLPSSLLARRPDIAQAEQVLIASNAQIGVARAAYFPQISLTGAAGFESTALSNLFTGPAGLWSLSGSFTQPIFQGGRLKSNVRLAEAQQQQAVLAYQQTIKGAFRDVSDALVAYRKTREFRIQQEHLVESAQDAARLSEVRFKAGTTDYLEVLTNETNSFTAELGLAQAQGNELTALVQLYQALGGGWK
ncbi:MAG: efflux transporter outer membrane subunit [Acidobacteriia bacterium]|nr:efflux transporter outer membrane subunit [Terriglobia bacterium]